MAAVATHRRASDSSRAVRWERALRITTGTTVGLTLTLVSACVDPDSETSRGASLGADAAARAASGDTSLTTTRRLLSDVSATDVLPDGRHILLVDVLSGDVAVRDLATGGLRRLTHNPAPWTPGEAYQPKASRDGQRVAYAWLDIQSGAMDLRVVDIGGGEPKTILASATAVFPADWSPDGKSLLASRWLQDLTQQIVLVPVDGGPVRVLKTLDWRDPQGLGFSPDGRFIAYSHPPQDSTRNGDIYFLAPDGSRDARVVRHPADDRMLGWTPDGSGILFSSDRDGTPGAWLLPVANGKPRGQPVLVQSALWRSGQVGFSRDGSFFYRVERGGRHVYVATIDSLTGRAIGVPTQITQRSVGRDTHLDWSPDGRSIAYQIREGGAPVVIAVHSLETGDTREIPLPARAQFDKVQRWLPNANVLLMRGFVNGRGGLFGLDVQTRKLEEMLGRTVYSFDVTPDGRSIVYFRDSTITVREISSGAERTLYQATANWIVRPWANSVSPDGSRFAFFRKKKETQESELTVIPMTGGVTTRVATVPVGNSASATSIAWSKDGRWLLFTSPDSVSPLERVWRVLATGGTPEPIGLGMEALNDIRFSRVAWRLAFTAGVSRWELWVMENIPVR